MSVETLALVLHHSRAKGTDKVILIGIANHNGDGGAWPSVATLAKYANVTERNVQAALTRLQKAGELMVHVQSGGPSGMPRHKRPNRYEVLVACPMICDRTSSHRPRDLWINGVSLATPGVADDTRGVSLATGEGVSLATPEPSIEPSHNPGVENPSQLQTRARCSVCSLDEDTCRSRVATSGHEYNPRALRTVSR